MQNNNNIKKVIPEPLLFIHTVSTPIMSNGSQRYYDSRDPEKSKSKEKAELIIGKEENKKSEIRKAKKIDELLLKKIQNIVQMYKLEHPIPTIIEINNNESYEGIPFKIENDMLYVNQDEQIIEIKLDDIKDAIILKI